MAKRRKNNTNNELQLGGQNFQVGATSKSGRKDGRSDIQVDRFGKTDKPTPLAALLVAAVGLYPLAIGLKVLPIPTHSLHAPYWVMTAVGCAVFFAGIAIGLQCLSLAKSFLYKVVAAIILLAMLTPFAWLVFGDSTLPLFFRIAFATPFAIIALILLPGGKRTITTNLDKETDGKPISELLKERRLKDGTLQEKKFQERKLPERKLQEIEPQEAKLQIEKTDNNNNNNENQENHGNQQSEAKDEN